MTILMYAILVLIIAAIVIVALDYLPFDSRIVRLCQALGLVVAALAIANRAGIV